jgi:hypothetical protein
MLVVFLVYVCLLEMSCDTTGRGKNHNLKPFTVLFKIGCTMAVSVASLSLLRAVFVPASVHVGFVVGKVALEHVFSPVSIIPPWLSKLISSGG